MLAIIVNKNKGLSIITRSDLYEGEHLADRVQVQLSTVINGKDITGCTVYLCYINSLGQYDENDLTDNLVSTEQDVIVFEDDITNTFTSKSGKMQIWVEIRNKNTGMNMITNAQSYVIGDRINYDDLIPEHTFTLLEQMIEKYEKLVENIELSTGINTDDLVTKSWVKEQDEALLKDAKAYTDTECAKIEVGGGDNEEDSETDRLEQFITGEVTDIVYYGDTLRDYVFHSNPKLETFIGPNVRVVGQYAFNNCKSVKSIKLPEITSITTMTVFFGCTSLVELYLPKLQRVTGQGVFGGCSLLKILDLPSLTELNGNQLCQNSVSLESVVLMSCKKITMSYTFNGCTALKEIVIGTPDCTLSSTNGFPTHFAKLGSIYVPDEAVDWYKSATNWSNFADIIKPLSERVVE